MTELRTTRALLSDGYGDAEIRRMARSGEIIRVRRGVFGTSPDLSLHSSEAARERHRRLVEATLPFCAQGTVVSHRSAAILWRLPVAAVPDRVEVTRPPSAKGHDRGCVHLRVANLDPAEVVDLQGCRITSRARTVVDIARAMPLLGSVVTGDAALAGGLDVAELEYSLLLARSRPGVRRARRAVAFFDGRSESGGESISRVRLVAAGLPRPSLQHEVFDNRGELIGRGDFFWRSFRTIGEFDGKIKYGRLLRPGQASGDVVWEEKRREDAIRETGLEVVRWTFDDLRQIGLLVERIERAFARGRRRL